MLDLQRIIVLCLPSLLFAATMEPGKSCATFFSVQANFDCFKVLQLNVERGISSLARVQLSLGAPGALGRFSASSVV